MELDLRELKTLDKKNIVLKNIDNTSIGILHPSDVTLNLRYDGISEISFTIYKDLCPYYDLLTSYRRIEISDIGLFIIDALQIFSDGQIEYKTVTAKSFEIDINRKSIPLLQGTFKFYSPLPSDSPTIIDIIMSYLPNWSMKSVDSELWNLYRTFDLSDKLLYDLIQNEISQAYKCVFEFDLLKREISIKAYESIPKKTDIYLSFNNLIQDLELTEKTEELYTALSIFGANNLSVNLVNPLGSTVYNFNHFLNTEGFMSDELKQAVLEWQNLIEEQQPIYSNYLTQRRNKLSELITLQVELTELKNELKSLEVVRDALLDSGLNATEKNNEVKAKRVEITNKENSINSKQNEIDTIDSNLESIQNTLAINNYFTSAQLLELEPFIIQTSVTDDEFVTTSLDSELDKQNTAQDLYDKYKKLLDDSSRLKFEFSTNLVDFIGLKEYEIFSNQLQWGSQITMEVNDRKELGYPMLLGLDITWDNDNIDIRYIFSTEVRLSDSIDRKSYANEVSNLSNKIAGDSIKWGEYIRSGDKDRVFDLFKNGLNADLIEVKNADSQEVTFNTTGLMGKKLLENGLYSDEQWKFINNKLMFTDDSWNTSKLAIGLITNPDGTKSFGYNGETVYGSLIAGNQLIIKNANNNFILDSNGAILKNASLTIEKGLNKILLDPTNGFKIQKKIGTTFSDMIYLDADGNAVYKGSITGADINGSSLTGGSIDIGSGNFAVDSTGKVIIKRGNFNIANVFTVDDDGTVNIKKGSLNINSNFIVDQLGNVTSNGNFTLLGNIRMGGNITWDSPVVKYQYSTNNSSWHTTQTSSDKYRRESWDGGKTWQNGYQFVGIDGMPGSDANVPSYIKQTYIDSTRIESPTINAGTMNAVNMIGSYFRGGTANSAYLVLGTASGNAGDLQLWRGGSGGLAFSIYDNFESIDLRALGKNFISSSGTNTYLYGNWNFSNANVTGLDIVARFA